MSADADRRAAKPRRRPFELLCALGLAACLGLLGAACQSTAPFSPSLPSASPRGCQIAVSWNNYAEIDAEQSLPQAVAQALADPSVHLTETDAKSSTLEQIAQVNQAVDDGVDVLIVRPQNPDILAPTLERAVAHGLQVVAVDYPVMNPNILFVGEDNLRIGELEARALLAARPSGRFVVIKGGAAPETVLRRQGMTQAGLPDVGKSSASLINVGETFTPLGDPIIAQAEMEEFLQRNANKVDMVFAEYDGLLGGVTAALKAEGLDGKVLVVGAGGDPWGLNRVALGLQVADVATDRNEVGRVVGEAALALCSNPRLEDVTTTAGKPAPFTAPGRLTIPAILVQPIVFDRSNLRVAIQKHFDTGFYVCQDVPPGSVDGC